jgi:transcription elongation factor Elf1
VKITGVATRMRNATVSDGRTVETVVCGKCGERFAIQCDPADHNAELIRKHASWVTDELVWDHIQERKHRGNMKLPKL